MQRTDIARDWHGKPYYSLDSYCKNTFHHKCYKIALNGLKPDEATDRILDMFAHTRNNVEFVNMVKKNHFI